MLALCLSAGVIAPPAASAATSMPHGMTQGSAVVTPESLDPQEGTMISDAELLATGCGSTCDGKNPATFKIYYSGCSTCYHYCADDATSPETNTDGINLELRYSPRCRTAWARVSSDFYYPTVRSYYTSGAVRTSYSGFAGSYYTLMVNDAGLLARAEASAGPTTWWTGKY
ncbi:DUF2690 domain-containing protein [Micromonospora sp. KC207]|uniref:DUF2690 domain-containing protein n=1 Tax=Micromonospora sp. KC207 TaxID=2530377 RepID=UPI0010520D96|nr:DUF2690 domain-containing protein [Micromonospora sp. KC207]TDC66565.1 DUF2690 domain-containing protein [Micromonospora sp. KC207]